MSGRWEAYVKSPFDKSIYQLTDKAYENWWDLEEEVNHKWGTNLIVNAAVESDLNQISMLMGDFRGDYRDNPEYLAELRQTYIDFYKRQTGLDAYPFTPIGPKEMFRRNMANTEWSCTALYYCPGPDDDIVMCEATELEGVKDKWTKSQHFRVKSTSEYLGDDEEIKNSPYRIIRFGFTPEEKEALWPIVKAERHARAVVKMEKLIKVLEKECLSRNMYDFAHEKDRGPIDPFAEKVWSVCCLWDSDFKEK